MSDDIATTHRWSDPAGEVFGALAKAQAKIKNAVKDSANPHFKHKYADLASVKEACWDALTSEGICPVQMPINYGGNVGVVTLFGHSSGQWIESTVFVQPTKFDAQGVGSVITYLRRYALAAMAGVAPDDDDGEAAVGRPDLARPEARTAQQAPVKGNGAAPREQAAPAPSGAAAEATKRWREIAQSIDMTTDPMQLAAIDDWPAFQVLDRIGREAAATEEDHLESMNMLRLRARKRGERLGEMSR